MPPVKMKNSLKPAGAHGGQLARAKRAAAWNSLTSPSPVHNSIPRPALCRRAARGSRSKTGLRASRGPRGPSGPTEAGASPLAAITLATTAARVRQHQRPPPPVFKCQSRQSHRHLRRSPGRQGHAHQGWPPRRPGRTPTRGKTGERPPCRPCPPCRP